MGEWVDDGNCDCALLAAGPYLPFLYGTGVVVATLRVLVQCVVVAEGIF
jgi:hypothetical protein